MTKIRKNIEDCTCHCHKERPEDKANGIQCRCIKNCIHCHPENFINLPTNNNIASEEMRERFHDEFCFLPNPYPHEPIACDLSDDINCTYLIEWIAKEKEQVIQEAIAAERKSILREALKELPRKFWEDEDHAVGGYISKKDLYKLLTPSPNTSKES